MEGGKHGEHERIDTVWIRSSCSTAVRLSAALSNRKKRTLWGRALGRKLHSKLILNNESWIRLIEIRNHKFLVGLARMWMSQNRPRIYMHRIVGSITISVWWSAFSAQDSVRSVWITKCHTGNDEGPFTRAIACPTLVQVARILMCLACSPSEVNSVAIQATPWWCSEVKTITNNPICILPRRAVQQDFLVDISGQGLLGWAQAFYIFLQSRHMPHEYPRSDNENMFSKGNTISGIVGCTPTNVPLWEIPI